MKYAICNETFGDWPLERAFAFAKECGYEGIEIAPFTIDPDARRISARRRREVRRQAEAAGLAVVGLHWLLAKTEGFYLTTPDDAVRRATGLYLADLARLCGDLGGKVLVLGSPQQRNLLPGVTHEEAVKLAADCISVALPALQEAGATLAVEPLGPAEGDFLNTADAAVPLIDMLASPQVRLHLDVKAMASEGEPIADIIRRHAARLAHFHANDPNLLGPGMGDVDFTPIMATLREIDYGGWVSVEVFKYDPGVEAICRESIACLRACE